MEYEADAELIDHNKPVEGMETNVTGIFVRAKDPNGKWGNCDIYWLTPKSLLAFLRSRGGENTWAEGTVFALLRKEMPLQGE